MTVRIDAAGIYYGGEILSLTNGEVDDLTIATPVYVSSADNCKRAAADGSGSQDVLGFVAATATSGSATSIVRSGQITATTAEWDARTGESGGLVPGAHYWLGDASAGALTRTAPTTPGHYVVQVGIALSTTRLLVEIRRAVLLSPGRSVDRRPLVLEDGELEELASTLDLDTPLNDRVAALQLKLKLVVLTMAAMGFPLPNDLLDELEGL